LASKPPTRHEITGDRNDTAARKLASKRVATQVRQTAAVNKEKLK
jgi:hypothetical protein